MKCTPVTPESIGRAVKLLREGGLAIVPTDTVYGTCADARCDDAVLAISAAKRRGPGVPLQLLFAEDLRTVKAYAVLNAAARSLVEALGPGGWTIVTDAVVGWESPALAGGRKVGIRIPEAPVVKEVVRALGAPLVASSANRHGEPSPVTCLQAVASVGPSCGIALDGGPSRIGLDSTVIDCTATGPLILREGAIDRATVARILGLSDIPVLRSVRP